jgi:hypothetical protein
LFDVALKKKSISDLITGEAAVRGDTRRALHMPSSSSKKLVVVSACRQESIADAFKRAASGEGKAGVGVDEEHSGAEYAEILQSLKRGAGMFCC